MLGSDCYRQRKWFLGDDLKVVAAAAGNDGESSDPDFGRLPSLVANFQLGQPSFGSLGIELKDRAFADRRLRLS